MNKPVQGREIDYRTPTSCRLYHQKKATVEAGSRIENDLQCALGQHLLDLLKERKRPRRPCLIRWKRYRRAGEGRKRVQKRDAISVPKDRYHPGLCSYSLPPPPVPDPFCLPADRLKRPVACKKGALPLRLLVECPREEEDEEEVDCKDCCDRETTGVLPPRSAADEAEEEALPCTGADFLGIRGGCTVYWTRASLEAASILVRVVSSKGEGKSEAVDGKGA